MFKVDFEKAYDSVNWNFLDYMMVRMGFNEKWRKWMAACIFSGSASVLINGSPTLEFPMERGLRQGDPLAPFLFLMVAEGLTGLVNKSIEGRHLEPFPIDGDLSFPVLQYADDTIFMCKNSRNNLWGLKAILRIFELVSGLRVNFHKSCLIGMNICEDEVEQAAQFLHCKIGELPFKFLGVPIGANPRLASTWKPVIERMQSRLSGWKCKQLSFGGRVTLIKSVLSSLPLYYFSFFKAPKKVLRKLTSIQRNFLWGGSDEVRKTAWISWDNVCMPKARGGLGIKNLEVFNYSLLGKWRWRLMNDNECAWGELLKRLYEGPGLLSAKQQSNWWRDIRSLDSCLDYAKDWFAGSLRRVVGNGSEVKFWEEKWCSHQPLSELFPLLYAKAELPNSTIAEMGTWNNNSWSWSLRWGSDLSEEERQSSVLLHDTIVHICPDRSRSDYWKWSLDSCKGYTVKGTYDWLLDRSNNNRLAPEITKLLQKVWKSAAPSKYQVHAWKVILERLPTRSALQHRGIIAFTQDPVCALCGLHEETVNHLFFTCDIAKQVWSEIEKWAGLAVSFSEAGWQNISQLAIGFKGKKYKKFKDTIWIATLWVIWMARNNLIFKGERVVLSTLINKVKLLSWSWFSCKGGG